MKRWTQAEKDYLQKYYRKKTFREIGEHLNRTEYAVSNYALRNGLNTMWTEEDIEYIRDHYGKISTDRIAKKLQRTAGAVRQMASLEGIGSRDHGLLNSVEAGDLLGRDSSTIRYWIRIGKLKAKRKDRKVLITEKAFIQFLRTYPEKWDATQCEEWYFRKYDWFKQKRKEDFQKLVKERWGEDAV